MKQSKIEKLGKMIDDFGCKTMFLRYHREKCADPINELMRCKELLTIISRGLPDDFDVLIMWNAKYIETEHTVLNCNVDDTCFYHIWKLNRFTNIIIKKLKNTSLSELEIENLKTNAFFHIAHVSFKCCIPKNIECSFYDKIFRSLKEVNR